MNKRDYVDHVLYLNDTLQEIKHEDGRLVPVQPGNTLSALEYQYHLNDHLGNVRATLTSLRDTDAGTATLESSNSSTEQRRFQRYDDARRISSALFDHTNGNSIGFSVRLNGSANEKYGLARSLSVMPGDKIQAEVYAKYADPNSANWTGLLPTLMSQIVSGAAGIVVDGTAYASSTVSFPAGLTSLQNTTDNGEAPPAYMNWLIFNRKYKFLSGGFVQISTAGKEDGTDVDHEHLSSPVITITEPGFVYVYLSNEESGSAKDVFFDDFTVTLDEGPVISQADYDPFGLTFNEFRRENTVPNNFLYNGKELQNDFELNLNDFGARMQDPAIGRWHGIDPLTEKYVDWSPYNYVVNNPIKHVDPDGKDLEEVVQKEHVPNRRAINREIRTVETGKRIVRDVEKNKNVKVYYAIVDGNKHPEITKSGKPGKVVLGRTDGIGARGVKEVPLLSKGTTLSIGEGHPLHAFDGLNISSAKEKNQTIFLVIIDSQHGDLEGAFAALHEFEAHVNIAQKSVYAGSDPAKYQHDEFGSDTTPAFGFEVNAKDGQVIFPPTNPNFKPTPGSTAEKLAKELEHIND